MTEIAPLYRPSKTAAKTVPPVAAVAGAEALYAILQACGVSLEREHCYQIALGGLAVWEAVANWLKNRKRGR